MMILKISTAIALLAARTAAQTTAGPWQQCGGIGFTGPTRCTDGWICLYFNPYFSFCRLPESTATSTATTTTTSVPVTTTTTATSTTTTVVQATAAPWAQCGGQGYTGPTKCADGWECVYENPWFSNCFQITTTGTSTTVTSSTSWY